MAPEEWFYIKSELKIDPEKGFEKLYNRLWEKMYSVSYNYVRDKAAAQEIVQDVFVSLWTKRDRLAEVNDILAFTMRAVQNRVYDHFDKQDVQQRYAMHVSKSDNPARETTQQQIEFNETFSIIDKEINSLPETTKTIFRLSRFHSFSNEEIAIKLQVG